MDKDKPSLKLLGEDGNAFAILGKFSKALATHYPDKKEKAMKEAKNGDYDHLLQTVMKYFEVE